MKDLKKQLRLTGNEYSDGLKLSHIEFIDLFKRGKIEYTLPNRYLPIFYRMYSFKWKQLIMQILLFLYWACFIYGVYLLFQKQWSYALISICGGLVIFQLAKYFAIKSIEKSLLMDEKYFEDLAENGIIGFFNKN